MSEWAEHSMIYSMGHSDNYCGKHGGYFADLTRNNGDCDWWGTHTANLALIRAKAKHS